jgi:hypothetical protein
MDELRSVLRRRSGAIAFALLALGLLERALWLAMRGIGRASGEATNVAIAFAQSGSIADPFGRGSGLTAHLNPLPPIFVGTVYRLFGIQSLPAELVLAGVSIVVVLASAYVLYRAFGLLGMPVEWRLVALALFCLLPLNVSLETTTFRTWEGAIAALLGYSALLLVLTCDARPALSWRWWIGLSALTALLFFMNPPLGVAGYAMLGLLMLRKASWRRWPALIGVTGVVLAIVLAPWVLRNFEAFDRFIPLRSNAGMELALANHPAAVGQGDELQVFLARLDEIHPYQSQAAFAKMQAAGDERLYSDQLGKEAKAWIAAHPTQFASLSLRHIGQFYFPPAWQWTIYERASRATGVKQGVTWAFALLGLIGALGAALIWRGAYLYVAALTLIPALPYAFVQPVLRYRYIVFALLMFLAIDVLRRIVPQRPGAR